MNCIRCGSQFEGNFCSQCGMPAVSQNTVNSASSVNTVVKTKKPIYKKWWFWLVMAIVMLVLMSAVAGGEDSTTSSENPTTEIETTIFQNIESISFRDISDIVFSEWSDEKSKAFDIEPSELSTDFQGSLEFISENPEIATIEYDEDSLFSNYCIIRKVGIGETYVYIQNKDGTIRSERIKVIVEEKQEETEIDEPIVDDEPIDDEPIIEEEIDNSRTVYITPTGKKYHYSRSCAGENAIETTEKSAKTMHDPCKKCAQ